MFPLSQCLYHILMFNSVGLLGNDLYQVIHTPLNKAYISRGVSDPEDSNSLWFMK